MNPHENPTSAISYLCTPAAPSHHGLRKKELLSLIPPSPLSMQLAFDAHLHVAAAAHIAEQIQSAAALAALGLVTSIGIVVGSNHRFMVATLLGVDNRIRSATTRALLSPTMFSGTCCSCSSRRRFWSVTSHEQVFHRSPQT